MELSNPPKAQFNLGWEQQYKISSIIKAMVE